LRPAVRAARDVPAIVRGSRTMGALVDESGAPPRKRWGARAHLLLGLRAACGPAGWRRLLFAGGRAGRPDALERAALLDAPEARRLDAGPVDQAARARAGVAAQVRLTHCPVAEVLPAQNQALQMRRLDAER